MVVKIVKLFHRNIFNSCNYRNSCECLIISDDFTSDPFLSKDREVVLQNCILFNLITACISLNLDTRGKKYKFIEQKIAFLSD